MSLTRHIKAPQPKAAVGERGKWAETEVQKVLKEMSDNNLHFVFNRTLDARAAGGRFPAQAGDFQWFKLDGKRSSNGIIEVKEVEHLHRLPFKNLDLDGYARMRKRELAGSLVTVLVAHKLPGMKPSEVIWRCLPLAYFADRSKAKGIGSWDLSDWPAVDFKAALRGL